MQGLSAADGLLVVDVQRDFCPDGSLAVAEGWAVCEPLSEVAAAVAAAAGLVVATRDWHPPESIHFRHWPPHCVAGTWGAELHPRLHLPPGSLLLTKGEGERDDAYSGFQAHDESGRSLEQVLRQAGIRRLLVGGLATDYCVRATVLDALALGFEVIVLADAIRAVELNAGDSERAIEEMMRAGAKSASSSEAVAQAADSPGANKAASSASGPKVQPERKR